MSILYSKLRGRIIEKFGSQKAFAEVLGQSQQTVTNKLNSEGAFTQDDMIKWCNLLEIAIEDIPDYFFAHLLK